MRFCLPSLFSDDFLLNADGSEQKTHLVQLIFYFLNISWMKPPRSFFFSVDIGIEQCKSVILCLHFTRNGSAGREFYVDCGFFITNGAYGKIN